MSNIEGEFLRQFQEKVVLRTDNSVGLLMKGALAPELEKLQREINRRMQSSSGRNILVNQIRKLQTSRFAYIKRGGTGTQLRQ